MAVLKHGRLWFGLAVSALALYLTLRNVDFAALVVALQSAQLWVFPPAFVVFMVGLSLRAARWAALMGGAPFALTFRAMTIGYMLNMTLPLRVGELGRAIVIGQRAPISTATAFSSIVVERLLDLFAVVLMFAGFALFIPMDESLSRAAIAGAVLAVGLVIGLAVALSQSARIERALSALLCRVRWLSVDAWLKRYRDFAAGFGLVRTPAQWTLVLGTTIGVWGAAWLLALIMMAAFLPARAEQAGLMMVASNLGGAAPSAPGGLGPVQLFAKVALVLPFGVDEARATALVFVWSLSQQLTLVVLGLVSMAQVGLSFGQLRLPRGA